MHHQGLNHDFNMKDTVGWTARWLILVVEYNFETCCQAGSNDASADHLSRPVEINQSMSNAKWNLISRS